MTLEQRRWRILRARARACLDPDFTRRAVQRYRANSHLRRREYILIAATALSCLAAVAAANWYLGNRIQRSNLARWRVVESQINALRASI